MENILDALQKADIKVEHEVSGRKLSTFQAGGNVRNLLLPKNIEELQTCLRLLRHSRYHVIGGGSNTLISDFGLEWVICTRNMKGLRISGDEMVSAAGEMLPQLSKAALEHALSGLEFGSGIPATVGGALRMNAGAYGQDMAGVVTSAVVVTADEVKTSDKAALGLRYRDSQVSGVVAEVTFRLTPKATKEIAAKMEDMQTARAANTPRQPSLGCVFKAASGVPAAKLIQGCGLKGTRIGQAQLSGVHCNYIVNTQGATARDYLRLVDVVKSAVHERYGINLEEEFIHIHD